MLDKIPTVEQYVIRVLDTVKRYSKLIEQSHHLLQQVS